MFRIASATVISMASIVGISMISGVLVMTWAGFAFDGLSLPVLEGFLVVFIYVGDTLALATGFLWLYATGSNRLARDTIALVFALLAVRLALFLLSTEIREVGIVNLVQIAMPPITWLRIAVGILQVGAAVLIGLLLTHPLRRTRARSMLAESTSRPGVV